VGWLLVLGMQPSLRGQERVSATSAYRSHPPARARAPAPSNQGPHVEVVSVDEGSWQVRSGPMFSPLSHFIKDDHWRGIC